ncbi:DNA polymerase III subunit gamma/tau, partial [Thermophilibacter sp. ZX-H3]
MESLYTKYRPQTFEQVVGQGHVVETLKRAVLEGRTSHAYLFCGPRGTGKTTMARILAKALMCERGPAALPDGTCEQCQLIASGEHPDVIELDAASRTGVDNVREEIISRVSYAPTRGRCKVYIIDEVHMLTTAAFNALLKTLEEPPEHVVFIMCTTDPQKILATILSRVQRFDFHAIGNEEMQAHLAYVCGQEGFTYDERALELIVRHARGGMRDALTTLEQLSVFGAGEISLAAASDFLGEVSGSVLGQVSRAMAHRDVAALFSEVASLAEAGRDLLQFTRELAAHVRDVYVVSVVPSADDVVSARGEELDSLRGEAAAFGAPDRLSRVLTILGEASSEMRTAPNQRLVLEIAFTRIARPDSDLTLESLAERVADLERQVAILSAPGARPAPISAGEKNVDPAPAPQPQPQTEAVPEPTAERGGEPVAAPAPERPTTSRPEEAPAVAAGPAAPSPSASRAASEERSDERRA